jgi:hypothetical protein
MPAPYKTAREILEDAIAHNRTPYEEVRHLADTHHWTDTQTLETLHAIEREFQERERALETIHQANTIRASLEDAVQVDHLEESQVDEILAILERAGY